MIPNIPDETTSTTTKIWNSQSSLLWIWTITTELALSRSNVVSQLRWWKLRISCLTSITITKNGQKCKKNVENCINCLGYLFRTQYNTNTSPQMYIYMAFDLFHTYELRSCSYSEILRDVNEKNRVWGKWNGRAK